MKNKPTLFKLVSSNKVDKDDNQKLGLEIIDKNATYAKKIKLIIWLYFLMPLGYVIPIILIVQFKWHINNITAFKIFLVFYIILSLGTIVHTFLCLLWLGRYTFFGAVATGKKLSFFTSMRPADEVVNLIKTKSTINYLPIEVSQYENLDYSQKRFEMVYWLYSVLFLLLFIILFIIIFISFLVLFNKFETEISEFAFQSLI